MATVKRTHRPDAKRAYCLRCTAKWPCANAYLKGVRR